jgi:hypothetical protein
VKEAPEEGAEERQSASERERDLSNLGIDLFQDDLLQIRRHLGIIQILLQPTSRQFRLV